MNFENLLKLKVKPRGIFLTKSEIKAANEIEISFCVKQTEKKKFVKAYKRDDITLGKPNKLKIKVNFFQRI